MSVGIKYNESRNEQRGLIMYFRYCVTAKNLLDRNNIPYQSIELDKTEG